MIDSLPFSPPSHSSAVAHHRESSTNSGYLSRAELFGRSSPATAPSTLPPSRGLDRIEERHLKGHSCTNDDVSSSTLARLSKHGVQALPKHQSTQSLRGEYAGASSFTDLRPSRAKNRNSASDLRTISCDSTRSMTDSGHGPGPTLTPEISIRFSNLEGSGRKVRTLSTAKIAHGGREWSSAENALRNTLSSAIQHPQPTMARTSSWTSKLTNRSAYLSMQAPAPKTPLSKYFDNNGHSVAESSSQGVFVSNMHPNKLAVQTQEEIVSVQDPIFNSTQCPEEALEDIHQTPRHGPTNVSDHDFGFSGLPKEHFSIFSAMAQHDQDSAPHQHETVISLPITFFEQEPRPSQQHLSLSPIHVTASEEPLVFHTPQSLSFVGANAIIYGCITIAPLRFMVSNLGQDVRTIDLASEIGKALLVGPILCIAAHLYDGKRLRDDVENIVRASRGGFVKIYQAWLEAEEAMYAELMRSLE
jgi:hypothetical protein